MAQEPNPFGVQPPKQPPAWGGMPQIAPQEQLGGLPVGPEGSYFQLSPEAMQMMWAPQAQPGLTRQPPQPLV